MIDFKRAKQAFKEYVNKYDIKNGMIELKIIHTYEVVNLSEYIAKEINLRKEDIELAKLIALLHDIGRFEQAKQYNSFIDSKTTDHADLGVKILFEDNLIRNFIQEDSYDSFVYKAVKNHNKYRIEDKLTEKELLHAKIIRDADKIDIYRTAITSKLEDFCGVKRDEMEYASITPYIFSEFTNKHSILIKDTKTCIDKWIVYPAFIFDCNFIASLKYIKQKDYINKIISMIDYKNKDTQKKMEEIKSLSNKYLEEKCKEKLIK